MVFVMGSPPCFGSARLDRMSRANRFLFVSASVGVQRVSAGIPKACEWVLRGWATRFQQST